MSALPDPNRRLLLYTLLFASGAAGLIFEMLWFRLAGLSFGNTVWAGTAVLAAFMGGLAVGHALTASGRLRLTRPLYWYALAEAAIALTGTALLWILPNIGGWLAPVLDATPGLRLGLAFCLMLIPTSAMGLTLPLLVRALYADGSYGALLGRIYGINTLGAVVGVVAAEFLLLGWLGTKGSGLFAASLNLVAAGIALWLTRDWPASLETRSQTRYPIRGGIRWLIAAGLSGTVLLALEVVWFRLLLLHVRGTASAFAAMLAIVLVGIALGGLLTSWWLRRRSFSPLQAPVMALLCALTLALGYRGLPVEPGQSAWLAGAALMLGTAIGSGALFTLLCVGLTQVVPEPSRATGRLLVANTGGGMLGAILGGLVLLPLLGMQASLAILLCAYLICTLLLVPHWRLVPTCGWAAGASFCLLLFPWGQMQSHVQAATKPWQQLDGSRVVYQREGINETLQLLQRDLFGEPLAHRIVTNGESMSGTERDSQRYMKLFAWLPMALHPGIKDVLLISYGLGSTAEALVADRRIHSISVVDISPEMLEASRLTRTDAAEPLDDSRVKVHIEDGRHFLLTSHQQFDLITGEPPPPRLAGIVNLYSREYFSLMHRRLKPGGMASYWLPADQLTLASSRAILKAFCEVFRDCSLWSGSNYNWVMLGSRDGIAPVPITNLTRFWQDPATRGAITALGFETPAQLGTTFIADANQIIDWIGDASPLTDDRPKRLSEGEPDATAMQTYARLMDNAAAAKRFASSAFIRHTWPMRLQAEVPGYYDLQPILNNEIRGPFEQRLRLIDGVIEHSSLKIPVFWLLESGIREQRIVDRRMADSGYDPEFAWHLAVRALADRRFDVAAEMFSESGRDGSLGLAVLSYCRAGMVQAAMAAAEQSKRKLPLRCW